MALSLHPKCIAQLKSSLAAALGNMQVKNRMFLERTSLGPLIEAESALPTSGKVRERLDALVSETPLFDFVQGTLARELIEGQTYSSDPELQPLQSIAGYEDLAAVSSRLVDEFESLPWEYAITLPLSASFSEIFCSHFEEFALSDRVQIRSGGAALQAEFPLVSGVKERDQSLAGGGLLALLRPEAPTWSASTAYLHVKVQGFIGKFVTTEPYIEAVDALRSFFGLGIALRLFKPVFKYQSTPPVEKVYVHRRMPGGNWMVEDSLELETVHAQTVTSMVIHDLDGKLDTATRRAGWMKTQLQSMGHVFRAGEGARNIALGARWLFDSHSGSDELLQFVQAAVVVEILLGDKAASDLVGLGELLSSRCAYLIAASHAQRSEIMKEFKIIYDVRSKIVHRGKSKLQLSERRLFNQLRWMCRRIIQEEVKLLAEDVKQAGD